MAIFFMGCLGLAATASAQTLVAISDSGTADAGIGSEPIANVTANDTVDGAPAVLTGTGANVTVTKASAWPAGMTLNAGSGAVLTSSTLAASTQPYAAQYSLCSLSAPPTAPSATSA